MAWSEDSMPTMGEASAVRGAPNTKPKSGLWRSLLVALVVASTLWTAAALGAEPTKADRAAARQLAGEAMDLLTAGDFEAALAKFTEADQRVPAPTLRLRMARCLDKLDRMKEAAERYREVIAYELKAGAPGVHREARKEAVPELAALLEQVPSVTVMVDGPGSSEATVAVNGEALDWGVGEDHELDPGHYAFRAEQAGRVATEEIDLARGEHLTVVLKLPELAAVPVAPTPTPAPEDGAAMTTAGWVAVGVGGLGLTLGIVTGAMVLSREADLEARCPDRQCPPEAHDDAEVFDALRTTSTIGFVIGGVGLATGVTLLLLAPGDDEAAEASEEARLEPFVGIGALGVRGVF
jgi:hypothetical protein